METVYLAGPIAGCTDAQCKDWRNEVKSQLQGVYHFRDPMDRDYRGRDLSLLEVQELVQGDIRDIETSQIVLVNANRPTWGTAMEVPTAYNKGKLVVVFNAETYWSPWLIFHSHARCRHLSEAVRILRDMANGR